MAPRSDVAYLVASEARPALLAACSDGAVRPCELVTTCDVSRATVHRALNGFLERGWVETAESRYSTTPFGETVLDRYGRLLDAVDQANEFGSWYQKIDADDGELPVQALCDGSIVTATSVDPTAPLEVVTTAVSTTEASHVRICTPTYATFVEEAAERVQDTDRTLELVVPEAVRAECSDRFDEIRTVSGVTLHAVEEELPCGIVVLERRVLLLGFDHDNRLASTLDARSQAVRQWATGVSGFVSDRRRTTTA